MRLCVYGGGLFSVTAFVWFLPRQVAGGAARFPSLKTVKTVTSPAMLTPPRQCENSAGGDQVTDRDHSADIRRQHHTHEISHEFMARV